jgi:hypothetical protein
MNQVLHADLFCFFLDINKKGKVKKKFRGEERVVLVMT